MSVDEIRQLAVYIDKALDVFRPHEVAQLSAKETRTRLWLAAAKRQLREVMTERRLRPTR